MPRINQLSSYKTTISGDEEWGVIVTYQSTQIVKVDQARGLIELRTGGWDTVTTRRKMNQAANQFHLPYSVFCKDHTSYVHIAEPGWVLRREAGVAAAHSPCTYPLGDFMRIERVDAGNGYTFTRETRNV